MSPHILGIVNITADSFSDGGKYLAAEAAIAYAKKLVGDGAAMLDLGAAASNPKAESISPEVEIARLAPVIAALHAAGLPVSIDTFSPKVQCWALDQGVAALNDIHGFAHPEIYPRLADSTAKLIVMHAVQAEGRATIEDIPPEEIFGRVAAFFDARLNALLKAGVARSRLILDPGMGMFLSRRAEASYEMLARIPELKRQFGLPVLIGVSRKSFLRQGRPAGEAGPATLTAEIFASSLGADYIRTHDVAALADGLAVWSAATARNITSI
ncbi:dihydropteroate synthase type 2 [Rhizomicrobium palustre]|uniref:Dihydropteroate synthase n=1 Tax=Rhizomicrobium palustre TaxID=189966 RepID=A0A846MYP2_9PROT|nr:dihydropteroate synthase [Rhizomicrobium palustre]NIK88748.1 dihydropteroate synthase type 2 [Rhizomicrobium palustre]